jgi:L-threonylcarbamoyladenylate synthase
VESTVLDLCGVETRILRPGGVSRETIEAFIGPVESGSVPANGDSAEGTASPGQLKSHYAPRCPLFVYNRKEMIELDGVVACGDVGEGLIFFDGPTREAWRKASAGTSRSGTGGAGDHPLPMLRTLSESGDTLEAAANLFALLHELDGAGLGAIRAQLAPDTGLGPAINDRLRRGAGRENYKNFNHEGHEGTQSL